MNNEDNDVVSKVAVLGAADLVPRLSLRRSLANLSSQSKKIKAGDIKSSCFKILYFFTHCLCHTV